MNPETPRTSNAALRNGVEDLPSISAFELGTLLLRRSLMILSIATLVVVAAGLYWRAKVQFVAKSNFLPEAPPPRQAGMASLAAQFGLPPVATSTGESVQLYIALLGSRELLSQAVTSKYAFVRGRDTTWRTLVDTYRLKAKGKDARLLEAIERLSKDVIVTAELSGLVTIESEAPTRSLAIQINRRLHALLNEFNLTRRQTRATAERTFVEQRLAQAEQDLKNAELRLATFLQTNVDRSSPRLVFEAASLQRTIDMQQQVFLGLSTAYEQARIAEVRDTPVITMVDPPELQAGQSINLTILMWVATAVGLLLGVASAIVVDFISRRRFTRSDEYAAFLAAGRQITDRFNPWRRARAVQSGPS